MEKNPSFGALLPDIDLADMAAAASPTINALSEEVVHIASRAWVARRWVLIGAVVVASAAVGLVLLRRRRSGDPTVEGQEHRTSGPSRDATAADPSVNVHGVESARRAR
jgi:hypothetical protein